MTAVAKILNSGILWRDSKLSYVTSFELINRLTLSMFLIPPNESGEIKKESRFIYNFFNKSNRGTPYFMLFAVIK